ncbi:MAG TPA: glutaredoxin family protein [Planctomycetaceae bacterium]|jgi:glutaredoxin|nr:glutaredoxin family protein [Planctomycetaceae bacterium]
MSTSSERPSVQQIAGAGLLFSGIALWLLILLDTTIELPIDMPRTWYLHRPLWGLIGLCLFGAGWRLQSSAPQTAAGWSPGPSGRRFRRLIVYSRAECHLCDEAKAVLAQYLEYLPEIEEIDIDTRPELQERFGTSIPVVEIDGEIRFRGRVDEVLLRRLIEATRPIAPVP